MFYIWERDFSIGEKALIMFATGESKASSRAPLEMVIQLGSKSATNFKTIISIVDKFSEEGGKYLGLSSTGVSSYMVDILNYACMLGIDTNVRIPPALGDLDKIKKVAGTVILEMRPSPTIASEDLHTSILKEYYKEYANIFGVNLQVNNSNIDSCVKVYKAALDLTKPIMVWFVRDNDLGEEEFKEFLELIKVEDDKSSAQIKPSYEVWKYPKMMCNPGSTIQFKNCIVSSKMLVINDNMEIVPCCNYLVNNIQGVPYNKDLRLTAQMPKRDAEVCPGICTFYEATVNNEKNLRKWFLGIKD